MRTAAAVSALALALLLPAPALAQQGETRVSVRLPDVLILSYLTDVQLQLSSTGQIAVLSSGGVASSNRQGTVSLGLHIDAELAAAVTSGAANSIVTARLSGVFSVIGATESGRIRVSTAVEQATGTHADDAILRVTQATVIVGAQQAPSVAIDAPGVAASVTGGIGLAVDLTDARSAGWYQGVMLRLVVEQL